MSISIFPISFTLNGESRVLTDQECQMTLLQYLRGKACLKGTKEGCSTGHCGACTVLIDGKTARACITKTARLEGKSVTTIEGLAAPGELHPIQKAFLDTGAIQCGFCTPGMILAAKALLDQTLTPSPQEIEKAFKHNYCRCTGYVKIIQAVELAAARLRGEEDPCPENWERTRVFRQQEDGDPVEICENQAAEKTAGDVLGLPLWDADGPAKAQGTLKYADDIELPGTLYGAPVWSGHAHARVLSVDTAAAEALPGVLGVLTARDVPGKNAYGLLQADQPVFCDTEVRFCRDVVALAVAESPASAQAAAAAVKVEYEILPAVFDMKEAKAKGQIHKELSHTVGDPDAAAKEPGLLKLSGHFTTPYVEHAYLEPESCSACYSPEKGLTVYAPTQSPFEMRRILSGVMDMPQEKIRIIVTPIGGGFGSKADPTLEAAAAVAAYRLGRPVKITLSREESLGTSTKRHPYEMDYEVGLDKDGFLRYFKAELLSDGGPYMNLSARVIDQACIFSVGPYRMPNGRVSGRAVRTNNLPGSAFRGFGINQVNFCMETLLDEAAEKLGIDPFELRLKNCFKLMDQTLSGEYLQKSLGIRDCLLICRDATREALAKYAEKYPQGGKVLGWGMASGFKNVGAGKGKVDDAGAIITEKAGGRLELRVSGIDMGQGFRTAMLQLAAEALDWDPGLIDVVNGDTDQTLHHGNAVGERQTLISGSAVVGAAKAFNEKLAARQAGGISQEPLSASYTYVAPKTFALYDVEGRASVSPYEYHNYPAYAYAAQSAILEVDTDTGKVRVLEVVCAHDLGRVINPHVVEGQLEGSCSMGIGYALSEEMPVTQGRPAVKYYGQLGLPTIDETPYYDILLLEDPDPTGPFGAKGVSEVATVPMTPAVINAIANACGIRLRSLPARPQDVLAALGAKDQVR